MLTMVEVGTEEEALTEVDDAVTGVKVTVTVAVVGTSAVATVVLMAADMAVRAATVVLMAVITAGAAILTLMLVDTVESATVAFMAVGTAAVMRDIHHQTNASLHVKRPTACLEILDATVLVRTSVFAQLKAIKPVLCRKICRHIYRSIRMPALTKF